MNLSKLSFKNFSTPEGDLCILYLAGLGLIILSLILEGYGQSCGLSYNVDSLDYLAAAKSFRAEGVLLDRGGTPFVHWPPLFPLILSFFDDPGDALKWIHLLVRVFIGFHLFWLAQKLIASNVIRIPFLVVTVCDVHLMMVSVFIWSEMIFVALGLTTLFCALRLERSRHYFVLLIICGLLLCLQRHAGLFWMTAISGWMLFDTIKSLRERILRSMLCFVISTSGFWIWNLYNTHAFVSEFNLYQHDYFSSLGINFYLILQMIGKLFLPFSDWLGAAVGLAAILMMAIILKKSFRNDRAIQLIIIVVIGYSIGFLILPRLDGYTMDRYFTPVVPLFYLISFISIEKIIALRGKPSTPLVLVMISLWTTYPLSRTVKNTMSWHQRSCSSNPISK